MPKKNLLLVDGDSKSLRMLEVSLRKSGFSVTLAHTCVDALQKVWFAQPDLIISDMALPGDDDGFHLVRQLKSDPSTQGVPVIFLSSNVELPQKVAALELGVDDILSKPIHLREVITRVRVLLEKRDKGRLERHESLGSFSGQLGEMGLVDCLQTIEHSKQTGYLTLEHGGDYGTIAFRDGKVCDAHVGRLAGERAFYRLLLWNEGSFAVRLESHNDPDVIELSTQGLMMEGIRRVDEWGRLVEQLPPLDRSFEIDDELFIDRLADLPDEIHGMLRLLDGERSLLQVIDESELGDLEALEIASKLFFEGIIYDVRDRPLPLPRSSDASAPAWSEATQFAAAWGLSGLDSNALLEPTLPPMPAPDAAQHSAGVNAAGTSSAWDPRLAEITPDDHIVMAPVTTGSFPRPPLDVVTAAALGARATTTPMPEPRAASRVPGFLVSQPPTALSSARPLPPPPPATHLPRMVLPRAAVNALTWTSPPQPTGAYGSDDAGNVETGPMTPPAPASYTPYPHAEGTAPASAPPMSFNDDASLENEVYGVGDTGEADDGTLASRPDLDDTIGADAASSKAVDGVTDASSASATHSIQGRGTAASPDTREDTNFDADKTDSTVEESATEDSTALPPELADDGASSFDDVASLSGREALALGTPTPSASDLVVEPIGLSDTNDTNDTNDTIVESPHSSDAAPTMIHPLQIHQSAETIIPDDSAKARPTSAPPSSADAPPTVIPTGDLDIAKADAAASSGILMSAAADPPENMRADDDMHPVAEPDAGLAPTADGSDVSPPIASAAEENAPEDNAPEDNAPEENASIASGAPAPHAPDAPTDDAGMESTAQPAPVPTEAPPLPPLPPLQDVEPDLASDDVTDPGFIPPQPFAAHGGDSSVDAAPDASEGPALVSGEPETGPAATAAPDSPSTGVESPPAEAASTAAEQVSPSTSPKTPRLSPAPARGRARGGGSGTSEGSSRGTVKEGRLGGAVAKGLITLVTVAAALMGYRALTAEAEVSAQTSSPVATQSGNNEGNTARGETESAENVPSAAASKSAGAESASDGASDDKAQAGLDQLQDAGSGDSTAQSGSVDAGGAEAAGAEAAGAVAAGAVAAGAVAAASGASTNASSAASPTTPTPETPASAAQSTGSAPQTATPSAPGEGSGSITNNTGPSVQPQDAAADAVNVEYVLRLKAAEAASRRGDFTKAVSDYKLALQQRPQSVAAHIGLGNAYFELDDAAAAIRHLETARGLAPRDSQVDVLLGAAYQGAGRVDDAIAAYKRYLELAPDGKFARDVKGILKGLETR